MGKLLNKVITSLTVLSLPGIILFTAVVPSALLTTGCDDATGTDTVYLGDTAAETEVLGRVINLDDEKGSAGNKVTDHYLSGDLKLAGNIFDGMGGDEDSARFLLKWSSVESDESKDSIQAMVEETNHFDVDPGVTRSSYLPTSGGPAFTKSRESLPSGDDFFETADYIGAFGTTDWMSWTYYAQLEAEEITDNTADLPMKTLTDDSIDGAVTLSADTCYLLDGFVFVEDGESLTIPAGTVIKARTGGQLNASALIVARGGLIDIQGTASNPVVMTAESDDLSYQDDINASARGLWGGLILLGKSTTQRLAGTEQIEGIDPNDSRGLYGGTDTEDSSGSIKYLSIRYGGTNIGEGNEINGLTCGGVGSKTVIENVEVYNNADDGFEFFGGTVNTKKLIAVGCGDDSFDWDEGFRGKGQFWVVIQSSNAGDRGAEMDGCASDNRGDTDNYSKPTIYNATFIGTGASDGVSGNMVFKFREETGGYYYNSIFTDFYGDRKTVEVE